ncbi:MAG: hypothetical protein ACJA1C_000682 [Crocinitomicaceae bacterium]|jgi:hypothetical protein
MTRFFFNLNLTCLLLCVSFSGRSQTDSTELYEMLDSIVDMGVRNYEDTAVLNQVGNYIHSQFELYSDNVSKQEFKIGSLTFFNVIALVGDTTKPRIVVGAHYDVCQEQDGADDNGSGVVGLITTLKNLKDHQGEYCYEFVAYTLEEPPFYGSEYMGSHIHATDLKKRGVEVYGMISLEMLGFFSDEKKSQRYPLGILKLFYGGKGDYITLVGTFHKGKFVKRFTKEFKKSKMIKTKKFTGPKSLAGIDFSDHRSYWALGMDAMMITDTSFYRNENYHKNTDTMDTLDYNRMAAVVNAVIYSLKKF